MSILKVTFVPSLIFAVVFSVAIGDGNGGKAPRSKRVRKKGEGHVEFFLSNSESVYGKRLSTKTLQRQPIAKRPLAWVNKNPISSRSLRALQRFVKNSEKYQMLQVYPNKKLGPKVHVGNGMTGERLVTTVDFDSRFDRKGYVTTNIHWRSPQDYLVENGISIANGYHKTEVTDVRKTYELVYDSSTLRKAFSEALSSEVEDLTRRDPALRTTFHAKRAKVYFNVIQYFTDFETLPEKLSAQIVRLDKLGHVSLNEVLEVSRKGHSPAGGWHSDGVETSVLSSVSATLKHSTQSLITIDKSGVLRGGGTALRLKQKDTSVALSERPYAERVVARFQLENGEKGSFAPSVGKQLFEHLAEPVAMKKGGSRSILIVLVSFPGEKTQDELSDETVTVFQGEQEYRSLQTD